MLQEQISTSSLKCLNGNAGFGVVAQTSGMAPNVARDVSGLSGYSHFFPAGDAKNPVAYLHVLRRSGGVDRHILSRVADCGNDYSGRTNRIGHHWIIEESDMPALPCGPAAIASQTGSFCSVWNEKSQELPRGKRLPNPPVVASICRTWQQRLGDAGWGGVVAERVEKGDPVSIIFEPGTDVLPLLAEVFALLPPSVRWRTTFSTFFMKSQEPPNTPKIQIKCFVVGSDEIAFARLTPNTLVIDLRRPPTAQLSGKYVELARIGAVAKPVMSISLPTQTEPEPDIVVLYSPEKDAIEIYGTAPTSMPVPLAPTPRPAKKRTQLKPKEPEPNNWHKIWLLIALLALVFIMAIAIAYTVNKSFKEKTPAVIEEPKNVPATVEEKAAPAKVEEEAKVDVVPVPAKDADTSSVKQTEQEEQDVAEDKKKVYKDYLAEEAKKNEIRAQLAKLPDVWENLALSEGKAPNSQGILPNSEFLYKNKDDITIRLEPFVNLNITPDVFESKPIILSSIEGNQIEFSFDKKETILVFTLNEKGYSYKWGEDTLRKYQGRDNYHRVLNRILLSKLIIEIAGIGKEIALWTPVEYKEEFFKDEILDGNNCFTLWKLIEGKEFATYLKDNSPMLLNFDELVWTNEKPIQKIGSKQFVMHPPSLAYAPVINAEGSQANSGLSTRWDDVTKVFIDFISITRGKLVKERDKINELVAKEFATSDYKTIPEIKTEIEKVEAENKNLAKSGFKEDKDFKANVKKIGDLTALLDTIKNYETQLNIIPGQIAAENEKWKNARVDHFTIDLLKKDTKIEDVEKPENRLPLFRVVK